MRQSVALLALASGLVACHGGSPTGPTPAAAVPPVFGGAGAPAVQSLHALHALSFISGETQQPVAGVRVLVDGRAYTTDSEGKIVLLAVSTGATDVDASASGFLERRTLFRSSPLSLWPKVSPTGLDEEYSARLVYNCTEATCPSAGQPLARVLRGPVFVVPSAEIRSDPAALEIHKQAAALLTTATEGVVTYMVADAAPPGALTVSTWIDPNDPVLLQLGAGGVTRRQIDSRGAITGATVALRSRELALRLPLVLHELGHTFGLGHSPRVGDVMFNGPEIYDLSDFSPRERLAVDLMLQRSPGNRFPDSDDELLLSTNRAKAQVLACGRP
ncbi:MAG TPA: hypothetical protein VN461_07085 [Vicinamibacteria bacterium]|jgi:hypothetical protein|nr:hypothetical protein [Vicinamibacteria bacterium]